MLEPMAPWLGIGAVGLVDQSTGRSVNRGGKWLFSKESNPVPGHTAARFSAVPGTTETAFFRPKTDPTADIWRAWEISKS